MIIVHKHFSDILCYALSVEARAKPTKLQTLAHARALRQDSTDAEAKLWSALRGRRLAGVKFRRQVPIGPFIADFCCEEHKLVIELDGGQHTDAISQDQERSQWLSTKSYRVVRFWNNEVLQNLDGVLSVILSALGKLAES
jgi:very-short-patch-repair endonuclease